MTAAGVQLLFVYGSLKRGEENHSYLAGQRFVAAARTASGYRMYELDGYPGMVKDGGVGDFVTGELWEVSADCLAALDAFEGVDVGLYRREPVALAPPHEGVAADTYLYERPIVGRSRLGPEWKRVR